MKIHRLMLQPLVENAFIHGMESKIGEKWIMISLTVTDSGINIQVRDNGVGIAEKRRREILNVLQNNKVFNQPEHAKGVGLRNLNARLVLHYGNEACLKISSLSDEGTTVSFVLPRSIAQTLI
jgi:two-component system sensor histidine kinase YesM